MSWITIGWIVWVAILINAIRWELIEKGLTWFLLIAMLVVLFFSGVFTDRKVKEEPIRFHSWQLIYTDGKVHYYAYKEHKDSPAQLFVGKDPNASPRRKTTFRNYYGFKSIKHDFGEVTRLTRKQ